MRSIVSQFPVIFFHFVGRTIYIIHSAIHQQIRDNYVCIFEVFCTFFLLENFILCHTVNNSIEGVTKVCAMPMKLSDSTFSGSPAKSAEYIRVHTSTSKSLSQKGFLCKFVRAYKKRSNRSLLERTEIKKCEGWLNEAAGVCWSESLK